MSDLRVAHTADVDAGTLRAARALLDEAFAGEFSDHDWDHSLGGMHALAYDDGELVGHASVVQRQLIHDGRALRTGYVEGVGVRADRQRRGVGGALMDEVGRIIRGGYDLGALGSTDEAVALYAGRGWLRWEGPTSALTPHGVERTPDEDGSVYVLPVSAELDLDGEITCDWRAGDVW